MSDSAQYHIGLMSGTSIDGIDVALVKFDNNSCKLVHTLIYPVSSPIKQRLISLSSPVSDTDRSNQNRIELLAELDVIMGEMFAQSANKMIEINQLDRGMIRAIGSHGQTIRHRPNNHSPFTLQIGDANIIAQRTGIVTVADFRRADIAAGGQGAPLAPAFHNAILRCKIENRIILNLGGIANITYLAKDPQTEVIGFDTGPANTLLDAWYRKHHPECNDDFDRDALFAQSGKINRTLLKMMLEDPYFQLNHPKSTGREYFSLRWLYDLIERYQRPLKTEDIQATLIQLTVMSIVDCIRNLQIDKYRLLACGGGMHNQYLLNQLSQELQQELQTTNDVGINGDYLEAMTFAWLAKQRLAKLPGNIPSVTGAVTAKILGCVYLP